MDDARLVGHWINEEDYWGEPILWTCSNCKETINFEAEEYTPKDNGYRYCPFCGAKMEEQDKNDVFERNEQSMILEENVKALLEHYIDACAICTKFDDCEKCEISEFIEELKGILK